MQLVPMRTSGARQAPIGPEVPVAGEQKRKLLMRVRRIRGQLDAVERRIEEDASCSAVLQQATACCGALADSSPR